MKRGVRIEHNRETAMKHEPWVNPPKGVKEETTHPEPVTSSVDPGAGLRKLIGSGEFDSLTEIADHSGIGQSLRRLEETFDPSLKFN